MIIYYVNTQQGFLFLQWVASAHSIKASALAGGLKLLLVQVDDGQRVRAHALYGRLVCPGLNSGLSELSSGTRGLSHRGGTSQSEGGLTLASH